MEALTGTSRKLNLYVGDGPEEREVEVGIPAGVEHGQQLLMQDIVRTQSTRVSLLVQVRLTSAFLGFSCATQAGSETSCSQTHAAAAACESVSCKTHLLLERSRRQLIPVDVVQGEASVSHNRLASS
jgi:hypothetical protein